MIATLLLGINFFGLAYIGSDTGNIYSNSPRRTLHTVSEHLTYEDNQYQLNDKTVIPSDNWAILIDENGDIIWSHNKPNDIPMHYTINDIAKLTKWYLNDYPVYVQAEDYGLVVLGTPKNSVGKYSIEYSMDWFDTLPQRILMIFCINLFLAALFACAFGMKLYKCLKLLTNGIKDLRNENDVRLKETGIFKELAKNINETSRAINRKNTALSVRDHARLNWIAGISHDIRTPLSMVMGYSEALESNHDLSDENRKKAGFITAGGIKIKKLIDDLNLISSLEYDMQPTKKKDVRICPVIRDTVSEILNNGLSDQYEIALDLKDEKATILCDKALISRALYNLVNNSIVHNIDGCFIEISEYSNADTVFITISDHGCGVPKSVLDKITEMPKSAHGIGLPLAYKIITVHGGQMTCENKNGFIVHIELPIT